jgi:hypothetical protein
VFVRLLLKLADGNGASEEGDALRNTVAIRAILAERTDSDQELVCDPDNIGYLRRSIGMSQIFVPFNLASVFPGASLLSELIGIARHVALGPSHPICISGSTTFLGRNVPIGDLDFCEYFPAPLQSLATLVRSKIGSISNQVLVRVNLGSGSVVAPWDDLESRLENFSQSRKERLRLDFFWSSQALGALPTSSIVLPTNSSFSDGLLDRSHPYQEAVISVSPLPRNLYTPHELTKYASFLEGEIAHYLKEAQNGGTKAIKAIKRSLSLLLLIGADHDEELRPELNGLITDLVSPAVVGLVALERIAGLEELIADSSPELRDGLKSQIESLRQLFESTIPAEEESSIARRALLESATALQELIQGLFAAAGRKDNGHGKS